MRPHLLLTLLLLVPAAFFAEPTPAAVPQTYSISGRVVRAGTPNSLAGATVTLTNRNGAVVKTTKTAIDGTYWLTGIPAGSRYVARVALAGWAFTPAERAYDNLNASRTGQGFAGVRQFYTVGGRVADGAGGVGGVLVSVERSTVQATTDELGNFSLGALAGGQTYTLRLSKQDFAFEPARLTVGPLARDLNLSFAARTRLRGRVRDALGRGVYGVVVALAGTESGTTSTGRDGSYSFLVGSRGDYTVTPSKEQGYYSFAPEAARLTGGDGGHAADFNAELNTASSPSHVLEFDGQPKSVDYRTFWPGLVPLGHFFWEFWAMPAAYAEGTYLLSDGYGGNHALLFGFGNVGLTEPGRYQLTGNIWDGRLRTSFFSDEGPAAYEWGHFAVGWDGARLVTYFNGVPVGRTEFRGPRLSPGVGKGGGRLLVGGSDHSNLRGRIAQVRGYEGTNPREARSVFAAFRPQTVFGLGGNLLSYYFRPAPVVADMSNGHDGKHHAGVVRGTIYGILRPCPGCPPPQFVADPTAPDFSNPANPGRPAAPVDQPAPSPAKAIAFDSFSRPNSTYALGGQGGLGKLEGGTAAPAAWRMKGPAGGSAPFGILNGRAVPLADGRSVAWVGGLPRADLDVRVSRSPRPSGSGHNTGLSFRVQDADNFFFAYTGEGTTPADPKTLTVGFYRWGARTELAAGVLLPQQWTTLRVITLADGTIGVFADGAQVYAVLHGELAAAAGAGLYSDAPGLGLTNRWDNFTVLPAPQP